MQFNDFPEIYHGQEVSEARFWLLRTGSRDRGVTQHIEVTQLMEWHILYHGATAREGDSGRSGIGSY
ncbi:hypothetical protein CWM63_24840 [Klebsiella sp. F-Nf9]|nr:hypothetical protein CWM63_24840 [Klebsiella sp. F-Nf9]PKJ70391.1 hypothetical protein CW267_11910 [Klebsiella sp. X1-16S-Nf21]